MFPLVSLLIVVIVSLLIVRVATVALTLTGLSHQLARFQARSAFTGAGFTTTESEKVVQHPVRRRIIMLLMLLGNAGIVTAVSSLILSFTGTDQGTILGVIGRLTFLMVCLTALWFAAHSSVLDRCLSRAITRSLNRWTDLEARDYAGLLHLARGYSVVEMRVEAEDWMAGRHLAELKLPDEGVLVLGIETSEGPYLGAPRGDTVLTMGDTVLLYGPGSVLSGLDQRRSGHSGNWEHHIAVEQQVAAEQQERAFYERRQNELTTTV